MSHRFYRGKKPCPGCGISGEEKGRWGADNLCRDCKKLIELGKGMKEESRENDYTLVKLSRYSPKRFSWRKGYDGPYEYDVEYSKEGHVYISFAFKDDNSINGTSSRVMEAMEKFIESLDRGKKDHHTHQLVMEESWDKLYFLPTHQARAFFEFWREIITHEVLVQKEYFERGKNLLIGLSNGELTLKDFENK